MLPVTIHPVSAIQEIAKTYSIKSLSIGPIVGGNGKL